MTQAENPDPNNALTWWDWKADAQLAALELDQYPDWDNFDRAANTIINGMVAAADVLAVTIDMPRDERQKVALYYWAQVARVSEEMQRNRVERGVTTKTEAGEDGPTSSDAPPTQL